VFVGEIDTPGPSYGVATAGTRAYLADNLNGLVILPLECGAPTGIADPPSVVEMPAALRLVSTAPNPFHASIDIRFELGTESALTLRVYDITGRLVRNLAADTIVPAGVRQVRWDGRDDRGRRPAPGIYLCRIEAGRSKTVARLVLID
jgi:hypothetical protein